MNFITAAFGILFFALVAVTFWIWLPSESPARTGSAERRALAMAISSALFFLACFGLGVWISILHMKGELWRL